MNVRSVRTLLSGNPIMQVFSFLVAGLALIGAVLMGAVILSFVLACAVIIGIYFWIRILWQQRKMRRAASSQPQGRRAGQGKVIETEYTVIDEHEERD